jgi:molecular chaperone DnaK
VPAYFNDNQRQATKDAGRIAGLEVLRILNEPTAAALAYGFGKGLDQRVAVYDLGGGTFDISVLEIGKDVFEVLATCGDTFLGGDDFDDRILDLLADEFVAREGINLRNDPFAFEKLKVAAEAAKKGLSVEDEVEIRIPDVLVGEDGQPRSLERTITASEFATLVQDLVQRTFKVCDEALQQANLTTRDLDGIILVGGPTRLPIIHNAVSNYFQQEPRADVDPDEVVAKGAAIHAASLLSSEQESHLFDVTPLDLRIGVAGGLAESVIERNTPVPIEQSRAFSPFRDHQESVRIKVYQGDSRQADENELLGQFEFSGFEPGRRSDVSIDVAFEINADGIVSVAASDPVTGESASTTITLSSGLSDAEMSKILSKDRTSDVRITGDELAANDSEDVILEGEPELLVDDDDGLGLDVTETDLSDFGADFSNDPNAVTAPNDILGDPSDTVPIEGLLSEDGAPDPDAPSNAAIGKIQLQTVQIASTLPMAPGADGAPVVEEDVDDLFDHSNDLDLSPHTDPED